MVGTQLVKNRLWQVLCVRSHTLIKVQPLECQLALLDPTAGSEKD